MPDSSPHSMYENEHAEYLFAKVLAPHVCRMPVEQDRLDACHHLARLVEQLEAARRLAEATRILDVMLNEPAAEGLMTAEDYRSYVGGAWLGVHEAMEVFDGRSS